MNLSQLELLNLSIATLFHDIIDFFQCFQNDVACISVTYHHVCFIAEKIPSFDIADKIEIPDLFTVLPVASA